MAPKTLRLLAVLVLFGIVAVAFVIAYASGLRTSVVLIVEGLVVVAIGIVIAVVGRLRR